MASDWGSAFPEQKVNYVIAVRNNRVAGGANYANVNISSELPANLEVLNARADRGGDPAIKGNTISLKLATLAPGEGVEIVIETKVRASVAAGTTIVGQASLSADGLPLQAYSNVVSLLVVGAPPQQATATPIPAASATAPAGAATAAPTTINATAVATRAATVVATVAATPAPTNVAGGGGTTPTLPDTSAGVPLLGLLLLGMTMSVRTVRLHRDKSRV